MHITNTYYCWSWSITACHGFLDMDEAQIIGYTRVLAQEHVSQAQLSTFTVGFSTSSLVNLWTGTWIAAAMFSTLAICMSYTAKFKLRFQFLLEEKKVLNPSTPLQFFLCLYLAQMYLVCSPATKVLPLPHLKSHSKTSIHALK